jgi:hypothetical protein
MEEGLNPQLEAESKKPKKTWFFRRLHDDKILPMEEKAAWDVINDTSNQWRRQGFELLGCSDGSTYQKVFQENTKKVVVLKEECNKILKEIQRYAATKERLKFNELLDDADQKMIRVEKIIADKEKEYEAKTNELQTLRSDAGTIAFNAELEEAKKNPNELPQNVDVLTPHGRRGEILLSLGRK